MHFAATVLLPGHLRDHAVLPVLEDALDRYDLWREVPRYRVLTRTELIDAARRELGAFRDTVYAAYLADPGAYARSHRDPVQLAHLSGATSDGGFPARLHWSEEQLHRHQIAQLGYDTEDVGADGALYSTRNPEGQWDGWLVGGRDIGRWLLREGAARSPIPSSTVYRRDAHASGPRRSDAARKSDIDPAALLQPAHTLIDLDGRWHTAASVDLIAPAADSDAALTSWVRNYQSALTDAPDDTWLVNVDYRL